MPRSKTIIRMHDSSTPNGLPPGELGQFINKIRGPTGTVSEINNQDQHNINFANRMQSLREACIFLYMSQGKPLHDILNFAAPTKNESFEKCQDYLTNYANSLVTQIMKDNPFLEKHEAKHCLDKAEQYKNLKEKRGELVTVSKIGEHYIVQQEIPEPPFSKETKEQLMEIKNNPDTTDIKWYAALDKTEKKLLQQSLKSINNISDLDNVSLSSKLRGLMGVANFSTHKMMIYNESGKKIRERTASRCSHVGSRDVGKLKISKEEKADLFSQHAQHNLQQAVSTAVGDETQLTQHLEKMAKDGLINENTTSITIPIMPQTLITPLPLPGKPDLMLHKCKTDAINQLKQNHQFLPQSVKINGQTINVNYEFIGTNHALNVGRYVDFTSTTGQSGMAGTKLLELANQTIDNLGSSNPDKKARLSELATQYDWLLNTPLSKKDIAQEWKGENNRELFLASYEQLMVDELGGFTPGSSCVSGKDRKGLETMHTDAMVIYHEKYGRYPDPNTHDDKFADIFADLYLTRHQHYNSSQNAAGVVGLKTPDMYLPNYLCEKIQEKSPEANILTKHDIVATNNDVKNIKSRVISAAKSADNFISRMITTPLKATVISKLSWLVSVVKATGSSRANVNSPAQENENTKNNTINTPRISR